MKRLPALLAACALGLASLGQAQSVAEPGLSRLVEAGQKGQLGDPASSAEPGSTDGATPPPTSPTAPAPGTADRTVSSGNGTISGSNPSRDPAGSGSASFPQGDMTGARAQAKDLATPLRATSAGITTSSDLQTTMPGFTTAALPQQALGDDPEALVSSGTSAAGSSESYQIVTDPHRPTVTIRRSELSRPLDVERNPRTYVEGENLGGSGGSCTPLPPATTSAGTYEAMCNDGLKPISERRSCEVPLNVVAQSRTVYDFQCADEPIGTFGVCTASHESAIASGQCAETGIEHIRICRQGTVNNCTEPDFVTVHTLECTAPIANIAVPTPRVIRSVTERLDESACNTATAGLSCSKQEEVCIDSDPQTRDVNGVSVTRACWKWRRTYECGGTQSANDCGEVRNNPACHLLREECLDDPREGDCKVKNLVYQCPIPSAPSNNTPEYICGGDVYCVNGDCEPIEREASSEFNDALVGLHALGEAKDQFDPATMRLFSGKANGCHKPIFGLVNCCAGKQSGLLSAATGAAAIAAGPAAIAGLATPFLSLFLCSPQEKLLDVQDRMGLCHNLGTYCSEKFLGICTTRRTAYCCFETKLSRILQEQGRPQINFPWGPPKTESCKGFTIEQFAQLDLSRMDFTEVYSEFVDAARLPDEIATMQTIQQRIQQYYTDHGH